MYVPFQVRQRQVLLPNQRYWKVYLMKKAPMVVFWRKRKRSSNQRKKKLRKLLLLQLPLLCQRRATLLAKEKIRFSLLRHRPQQPFHLHSQPVPQLPAQLGQGRLRRHRPSRHAAELPGHRAPLHQAGLVDYPGLRQAGAGPQRRHERGRRPLRRHGSRHEHAPVSCPTMKKPAIGGLFHACLIRLASASRSAFCRAVRETCWCG